MDEWSGEYNDRKTEVEYLDRLRVDIERDIKEFSSEVLVLKMKAGFLQSLLDKTIESQFSENPRALMEAKVYSSFRGLPDTLSTTFDELKSTGRLALVRDLGIRNAMSEYYSGYASLNAQVNQMHTGDYGRLVLGVVPGDIDRSKPMLVACTHHLPAFHCRPNSPAVRLIATFQGTGFGKHGSRLISHQINTSRIATSCIHVQCTSPALKMNTW